MNKNIKKFIVSIEDAGQRIDSFLTGIYSEFSRSFFQKQIKNELILVNSKVVKPSQQLKADDIIYINFNVPDNSPKPQDIPLEIHYEDQQILVINKPSGMLTHPTSIERENTLVNALLHHTNGKLSTCNGTDRPGIVHRLDRNTSGLLIVTKDDDAYEAIKLQMQNRTIEKKYYALVSGVVEPDNGTITTNIGRHPSKPEKMAVTENGKLSITHYKVIEKFDKFSLLDITLETGRTHQIRVHMSHIGHPIVNDTMYGGTKLPANTYEQALQAYSLKFITPCNNELKEIQIPIDNDIMKALNYLRSKK